jgi:hypothetical protein
MPRNLENTTAQTTTDLINALRAHLLALENRIAPMAGGQGTLRWKLIKFNTLQ